jgi:hypothetical protein
LGRLSFKASLGKYFTRLHLKITRAKWTGSMAIAVEGLLCKSETLSSNPSPSNGPRCVLCYIIIGYFRQVLSLFYALMSTVIKQR